MYIFNNRVLRLAWLNAHFQTGLVNPLDDAIQAKAAPDLAGVTKVDEIPYDFVRKRLSIVVDETAQAGALRRLIAKGAFEQILAVSTQVRTDGQAVALDAARRVSLEAMFADWSGQGFRVLGVAERTVPVKPALCLHGDERKLRQHVQHGRRIDPAAFPARDDQADSAHQLHDRPARDDHRQRPRG